MPSPYNISLHSGLYTFQTDLDVVYACQFNRLTPLLSPILGVYDIDVHDFNFFPSEYKGYDERVAPTLGNLVTGYFTTPERALVYLCDTSDGRPKERQRLFSRWADMFNHQKVEIVNGANIAYGGVVTRKDFPYLDILQSELVEKAPGIVLEKYGH